jgi:hypothetical protein
MTPTFANPRLREEEDSTSGQNRTRGTGSHERVALCYLQNMSQPVKLSDGLVLDARVASEVVERSVAGQMEYWAHLGRATDLLLDGQKVSELCQAGANHTLSRLLSSVDATEGQKHVYAYLESQPFPHLPSPP